MSRDMSRNTTLRPKVLATPRMVSRVGAVVRLSRRVGGNGRRGHELVCVCRREYSAISSLMAAYCAAFTSFQISVYFARRGTFCQK